VPLEDNAIARLARAVSAVTQWQPPVVLNATTRTYFTLTAGNLPWHIIFGVQPSMVTTTLVGGRLLMRDRQLLTLDEQEIGAKAREIAPEVWERYRAEVSKGL
jgi:hypothetical protein